MGPIAYSMCQKPVIGILMFATNLCAFPPLIYNEPLLEIGASKEFNVPVDKSYSLDFHLFTRQSMECASAASFQIKETSIDIPFSFHVVIAKQLDQSAVLAKIFQVSFKVAAPTDSQSQSSNQWSNSIKIELARGDYTARIDAIDQSGCFAGIKIVNSSYSLVSGHGK